MYKNNWLTHNLKQRSLNNKTPLNIEFNFYPFKVESFEIESKKVCRELYDRYGNNLYLSFSGGSDSEFILKTFIELDIPITPVIVSCPYNQDDIKAGLNYCKQHNLKAEVLHFDKNFLELCQEKIYDNGFFSLIGSTPLFVYDEVKKVGGKVISGQGEPLPITIKKQETRFGSLIEFYEFEFYMDVYAKDEQPSAFFLYNQEIFYSYLKELDSSLNLDDAKCKLYKIEKRKKTYWSNEVYDIMKKRIILKNLTGINVQLNTNALTENINQFLMK
jgi:hypothetical protein